MTLSAFKTEIINRIKVLQVCPGMQDVNCAADHADILAAGADNISWAYRSGVIDDTLIEEFTDVDLNAAGIYKSAASLTNPGINIYLFKSGSSDITINACNRLKLVVAGNHNVVITLSGNAYLELSVHGSATVTINASDDSIINIITCTNSAQITIVANGNTITGGFISDQSELTYTGNDNSYITCRAHNNSEITYELFDSATQDIKTYNKATAGSSL